MERRLPRSTLIGRIGVTGVGDHRPGAAGRRKKIITGGARRHPCGRAVRSETGGFIFLGAFGGRSEPGADTDERECRGCGKTDEHGELPRLAGG